MDTAAIFRPLLLSKKS